LDKQTGQNRINRGQSRRQDDVTIRYDTIQQRTSIKCFVHSRGTRRSKKHDRKEGTHKPSQGKPRRRSRSTKPSEPILRSQVIADLGKKREEEEEGKDHHNHTMHHRSIDLPIEKIEGILRPERGG